MMKLEKVEFGGIQGKSLYHKVQHLYKSFLEKYKTFSEKPYDCLDVSNLVSGQQHAANAQVTGCRSLINERMLVCRSLKQIY